jgi:hypothetical protein
VVWRTGFRIHADDNAKEAAQFRHDEVIHTGKAMFNLRFALLRLTRARAPATLPLLGAGFHNRSDKRIVR